MIIFEGADATGKSTLLRWTKDRYKLPVMPRRVNSRAEPSMTEESYHTLVRLASPRTLSDRCDAVSSPIYRKHQLNPVTSWDLVAKSVKWLWEGLESGEHLLLLCYVKGQTQQAWFEREDQPDWVRRNLKWINKDYTRLARRLHDHPQVHSVSPEWNACEKKLIQWVEEHLERHDLW